MAPLKVEDPHKHSDSRYVGKEGVLFVSLFLLLTVMEFVEDISLPRGILDLLDPTGKGQWLSAAKEVPGTKPGPF